MKDDKFGLLLLVGRTIEQAVKDAIKERYSVVMTGSIASAGQHGPRMEDAGAGVVLADMQLYRGPRAGWVEVKSKTNSNLYRRFGIEEHGIDRSKAVEYWKLQKETGLPVYLLICEYKTGDVLMQDFDTLKQPKFFRKSPDGKMINWDRGIFARVGEFVIPAYDLRRLVVTIDWAQFETFCTQPILIEEE